MSFFTDNTAIPCITHHSIPHPSGGQLGGPTIPANSIHRPHPIRIRILAHDEFRDTPTMRTMFRSSFLYGICIGREWARDCRLKKTANGCGCTKGGRVCLSGPRGCRSFEWFGGVLAVGVVMRVWVGIVLRVCVERRWES